MNFTFFKTLFPQMVLATLAASANGQTFYKDVLPVLQQHCQTCHRPGEIGPMSLLDYHDARKWATQIAQMVQSRQMPPWFADPQYGTFSNDRRLSDRDIQTICSWVERGAAVGNPAEAPPPVQWVEGWSIGRPQVVIEMPTAIEIPASGMLPYQYMIVPTGFKQDTWVRLAEVRPGDRAHTHHIVVSVREPGSHWLRSEPVGKGFEIGPGGIEGAAEQGEFLAGYGPGASPEMLAPGQAKLIKAGSDLVFQLHYMSHGSPGRDRSRIGLILSDGTPKERVLMLAAANIRFVIPPGDPDFHVQGRVRLQEAASLISLLPHMHLRGKAFEFRVVYPDGRREILLRVPHYSYDWQLSYYLKTPLELPAGTTIECTGEFDNSASNPRNPDPTKAVRFGPQSTDEMMIGYFEVATSLNFTLRDLLVPHRFTSP